MSNTIRDLTGTKYIEMQNARFARKPVAGLFASDSWTKIRVALWIDLVSVASFTPTQFFFGLCSGTTNIPGDATPTNAIGARCNPATLWTYYSGTTSARQHYVEWFPYKDVGGVQTAGTTFGVAGAGSPCGISNSTNGVGPSGLFVTITKGSPNYTLDFFAVQGTYNAGLATQADFQNASIMSTPSGLGHMNVTGKALAFDQTAGTLDSAFVAWSDTIVARIHEWRVIRLA